MSFEPNEGQVDGAIDFIARGNAYSVLLTSTRAIFELREGAAEDARGSRIDRLTAYTPPRASSTTIGMVLVGANRSAAVAGQERLPGESNYFLGPDSSDWHTGIPTFAKVRYANVYTGIDLVYHGTQGQFEYDFAVAPNADPGVVRIAFPGADETTIDADGDLVVRAGDTTIRQRKPLVYQEVGGRRREISSVYRLREDGEVGFEVGEYDHGSTLIIDPVLLYSTYFGECCAYPVAVDAAGSAYVTGTSKSLVKFDASGSVVYSVFLGGPGANIYQGGFESIAVDPFGDVYLAGTTWDPGFPTTPGAFQRECSLVPFPWPLEGQCLPSGVVVKVDSTGSQLLYSTYLGVDRQPQVGELAYGTYAAAIAIDNSGNAIVVGTTGPGFPVTSGAYQTVHGSDSLHGGNANAFVAKLNASGSGLVYATYLGGRFNDSGRDVALDGSGSVYIIGDATSDNFPTTPGAFRTTCPIVEQVGGCRIAFVSKIDSAGSSLLFSTFLGGTGPPIGAALDGLSSRAGGIDVDDSGYAYLTGWAWTNDFPTTPGALKPTTTSRDAFVTKLTPDGGALVYSTYLGGDVGMWDGYDGGEDIAVDGSGNAYVTGLAESTDFPVVNAVQGTSHGGGATEAFVAKLNFDGSALIYSTYLGGTGEDEGRGIAVDPAGSAWVTGLTYSTDFPTKNPAYAVPIGEAPGFVAKIGEPSCPPDVTGDVDIFRLPDFPFLIAPLRLQIVFIRNHSAAPIAGPLAYVMDDLQNTVFIGSPRKTSCISPLGDPFMLVPTGSDDVLSPNEIVVTGLWFYKTSSAPLTYVPHVLSGVPDS